MLQKYRPKTRLHTQIRLLNHSRAKLNYCQQSDSSTLRSIDLSAREPPRKADFPTNNNPHPVTIHFAILQIQDIRIIKNLAARQIPTLISKYSKHKKNRPIISVLLVLCYHINEFQYQYLFMAISKKKSEKKLPPLRPSFEEVLVCKKKENRPFIEILIEEPENIQHQGLGTLFGIFQIDDYSEDSSYIVNYLISIIKKEYFTRTNRGPIENFEAALHKANLALSKLASHENINWIGHIHAVCAVIEKNNLLLSQTGTATALLLRGKTLTEITEIQPEQAELNPLKTFQDVISGRIEKNDKLLLVTNEIFEIFSPEEIKRSALKFTKEKFLQFLKTATINELDQSAVLVIDVDEKEEELIAAPSKKTAELNAFSQKAFQKNPTVKTGAKKVESKEVQTEERRSLVQELKKESEDFVDDKTGHIYIKEQGAYSEPPTSSFEFPDLDPLKEKVSDWIAKTIHSTKKWIDRSILSLIQIVKKAKEKAFPTKTEKKVASLEARLEENIMAEKKAAIAGPEEKVESTPEDSGISSTIFQKSDQLISKFKEKIPIIKEKAPIVKEKFIDLIIILLRKPVRLLINFSALLSDKWKDLRTKEEIPTESKPKNTKTILQPPAQKNKTDDIYLDEKPFLEKIRPNFSRLIQITKKLNSQQRMYAILIAIVILVVPYWIAKWERNTLEKKPEPPVAEYVPPVKLPLESDKNIKRITNTQEIYPVAIKNLINLNGKIFAQKETEIVDLESKKTFPLPSEFQNPDLFLGMADLNLIFIIKNNQTTSLSPTTGKFLNNTLAFPEGGKIVDAKTYLTYIYLLDAANNQIYRVPRAEGGFGEKSAWMKDTIDLKNAKSMAINDNIFVLDGNEIIKLFKSKKQPFSIESTATPIAPDKLYSEQSLTNLYILDKNNSRIIKLDNNGLIIAQYYNTAIATVTAFAVNEETNLIYISTSGGVKSFQMN